MKKIIIFIFAFILGFILGALVTWYSFDQDSRCYFLHGKNLCDYYKVSTMDPTILENFEKMISICKLMDNTGKKDGCFESIALAFSDIDKNKTKEACDNIKNINDINRKNRCYDLYFNTSNQIK